jgi:hypothetical protein
MIKQIRLTASANQQTKRHDAEKHSTINPARTRDIARTRDNKDTDEVKLSNLTINLTSTRDITRTRGKEDSRVGNIQQVIHTTRTRGSKYNQYYKI